MFGRISNNKTIAPPRFSTKIISGLQREVPRSFLDTNNTTINNEHTYINEKISHLCVSRYNGPVHQILTASALLIFFFTDFNVFPLQKLEFTSYNYNGIYRVVTLWNVI